MIILIEFKKLLHSDIALQHEQYRFLEKIIKQSYHCIFIIIL